MSEEKFQNLLQYKMVMGWVRSMLKNGTISKSEYNKIDTIMTKRYGLSLSSIFRVNG